MNGLRSETQFSVFLESKPGHLARVVQQLAKNKVNIVALSMMDSSEHGVLRLVAENPEKARSVFKSLDLTTAETPVLCATLPNRPGGLADVVERLASEHIHVNYAYCTTGARGGKTLGVFKVSQPSKAVKVLQERKPRRKALPKPTVRTRGGRR
ncbi:MAG: amino acid-binding protein [Planctomycetota bacterium]|nr:MAG: amino acid-binding protein [Planctomycetota bacterium]